MLFCKRTFFVIGEQFKDKFNYSLILQTVKFCMFSA